MEEEVQPEPTTSEPTTAPAGTGAAEAAAPAEAPVPAETKPVETKPAEGKPQGARPDRPPRGDRPPREGGGQPREGGGQQGQGRGPRPEGQNRGDRPPREGGGREGGREDRRGDRREGGRPGGGDRRPFESPEIEIEKLITDSLYLDNQAHAVVARMRDMDSGTKSQLRRLYNAVRRAVRAPESERQHQFVMLRARLAYTIARHSLRSLDALERLLLQVTRKNDARGYERFKDLFEAIVAYNE